MIGRIATFASLLVVFACSSAPTAEENKAATLARDVPLSAAFASQGKTLAECLGKHGYKTSKNELLEEVHTQEAADGSTVYQVWYQTDDPDDLIMVGVAPDERAVGGWGPDDVAELKSLGCVIDSASLLTLK